MNLDSMYQDVILDHYKNPQHAGLREPYQAEVHHVNPSCGDELTLRVRLSDDGKTCLLYTSPSPRDRTRSRMPSSA